MTMVAKRGCARRPCMVVFLGLLLTGCAWLTPTTDSEPAPSAVEAETPTYQLAVIRPELLPPPEERFFIHTINRAGETLMAIARWYTGEGRNWVHIANANPSIEPKRLQVGDKIRIPEALLVTRKPLPGVSVAKNPDKPRRHPSPSLPQKAKPAEIELYGPIMSPLQSGETSKEPRPAALETLD